MERALATLSPGAAPPVFRPPARRELWAMGGSPLPQTSVLCDKIVPSAVPFHPTGRIRRGHRLPISVRAHRQARSSSAISEFIGNFGAKGGLLCQPLSSLSTCCAIAVCWPPNIFATGRRPVEGGVVAL